MKNAKGGNSGGWTRFDNIYLDEIMPKVSANAWKVISIILRQTVGWVGDGPDGRKKWDVISYSQFMRKAGIASPNVISDVIKELLRMGIIRRERVGKQDYEYSLNTGLLGTDLDEAGDQATMNSIVD